MKIKIRSYLSISTPINTIGLYILCKIDISLLLPDTIILSCYFFFNPGSDIRYEVRNIRVTTTIPSIPELSIALFQEFRRP